jgi:hypothetical protein
LTAFRVLVVDLAFSDDCQVVEDIVPSRPSKVNRAHHSHGLVALIVHMITTRVHYSLNWQNLNYYWI